MGAGEPGTRTTIGLRKEGKHMHFSGSRTKAIACEIKNLWKSASPEKQWVSKIVKVNFSKTLEINKRFPTTQGKEPNLGKNRQDCIILTCSLLIPSPLQLHSSLENHSSMIKGKTSSPWGEADRLGPPHITTPEHCYCLTSLAVPWTLSLSKSLWDLTQSLLQVSNLFLRGIYQKQSAAII